MALAKRLRSSLLLMQLLNDLLDLDLASSASCHRREAPIRIAFVVERPGSFDPKSERFWQQ